MTDRVNQHFVPQYYFRQFSANRRTIGTLLTQTGRVITHAPIKGQCARKNFYGSKKLEALFSRLEARQCQATRAALEIAYYADAPFFSGEELADFFYAITFQRGRAAVEIDKHAPAAEKIYLEMFKQNLMHRNDIDNVDEMIKQIDAGNVSVTEPPHEAIRRSLSIFLESTVGITDLNLHLLRNRTDYPFIFSDAPVVFYNTHCRNVRNRGVLGLQCPGLQIFYPLNPWTLALLLDGDKYRGPFTEHLQYDVVRRSDVSQLNALQLHHSLNAVYFGDPRDESYIVDLWNCHRTTLSTPRAECTIGADFLVDGERPDGDIIQLWEPQLDYELNLSFIECDQVPEQDYVFAPRSPELREELRLKTEM